MLAPMSIVSKIIEARGGDLIVDIRNGTVESIAQAAKQFGLDPFLDTYFEVSPREAEAVLAAVLIEDMAYHNELVPRELAAQLSREFIGQFISEDAKFYTNGEFGQPKNMPGVGPSWSPATGATFDTGVLVISPTRIACAWFMDED